MKIRLLIIIGMLCALNLVAQEKAIKQYGFWDNWFIQPQFGASYTTGEGESFGKLLAPAGALSVGKYFSPEVGARLQVGASKAKGSMVADDMYSWNYMYTTVDILFNLNNIFAPYKEDRKFNFVALMGGGWNHGFENKSDNIYGETDNIVVKAGLQANFRINHALDFNLEGNINATDDVWNHKAGSKYDTYYNLLAGVTYKFKNRGFELVEPSNPALIRSLNEKINEQRAIIDNIKPCPEPEPCPEPVAEVKASEKAVVVFRIGKSTIAQEQMVSIYNISEFLKKNPETKVKVTGYADAGTGTSEINRALSEKRANAVSEQLKQFGIPANRITTESKGAEVQPFDTNDWNRVVIMIAE